jgi:hypothetical protein
MAETTKEFAKKLGLKEGDQVIDLDYGIGGGDHCFHM